jgi:trigger factor
MEYKVKKKSDTQAVVTFTATSADIEQAFEKAYVRAAAKVKLPGFRPGKAPLDLVKKHLGYSVMEDAAKILIMDAYNNVLEDLDPRPVSQPVFNIEKFEPGKGAEFSAEYEFFPEIKINKYRKLKVEQDQPEFDDSLYETVLKRLQQDHLILMPVEEEPASEGDVVTINVQILHGKKELYRNSELQIDTGRAEIFPGMKAAVTGRKAGERYSYEVEIDRSFPDRRYAGKKVTVSFETIDVRRPELPEINDELASQTGEFSTLADLKVDIKNRILKQAEEYLRERAVDSLLQQIVEKNPFPVPEVIVEMEVERILTVLSKRLGIEDGKRITLEGLAKLMERPLEEVKAKYEAMALENVRSRMAIDEVARMESIEVSDAEIDEEIRIRLQQAGIEEGPIYDSMMQGDRLRNQVRQDLTVKKTLDWLYQNAEVKKGAKVSVKKLVDEGKIRI